MADANTVIASFKSNPDAWKVTPAQCLMKNGPMRVWLRDGLNGYSSGCNMTCDDGPEWSESNKDEFAALWALRKRKCNIPQFPYPHRTMEEIFAEEDAAISRNQKIEDMAASGMAFSAIGAALNITRNAVAGVMHRASKRVL